MSYTPLSYPSSPSNSGITRRSLLFAAGGRRWGRGVYGKRLQHTSQRFIRSEERGTGGKYGNGHIDYA